MHTPYKEASCVHCSELSDGELSQLRERIEDEHDGHEELGRYMLGMVGAAALIMLLLIVFAVISA